MSKLRYKDVLEQPELWLTDRQRQWLRPRHMLTVLAHTALYILNWISVRLIFRLSVEGQDHLPASGPFILTPNHASPFDPPILGAAIPLSTLRQTYWAGKRSTVLRNPLRRLLSWLTRIIPIDDELTALAPAVAILDQGDNLIWFPEGRRSIDGRIQT
ncbi:MAG: 1-acyl-sn-glycerol-3-phosphate acyltransferase, partial [Fuerstiella sp.]|nr:1-acyl-sn-glycerol-3-phosphate acyltransferase [Fuerstiella sp.]